MTSKRNYEKKVLSNGMRYIFIPLPDSQATTVLVLVAAGSEYETKEINGISHFLEHLCFKGTKKRPTSDAIASELDALGAEYNAFTGNEATGYYAKVANKNFEKILDVVSDLYLNPLIDRKEMDKERGVIIEEINMYEDLPMEKVRENLSALLYGDQPAGWSVAGTKQNIERLTRDDILAYRDGHYTAPKTVVIVSGGIENPENLVIEKFASLNAGEFIKKEKTKEEQSRPMIHLQAKKTDQTHIVFGIRAFNLFDERRYALSVLSDVLGGSMSSRLFKKVREEMGAAYYVRSGVDLSSDAGVLSVSAGIDKSRLKEIVEAVMGELRRLTVDEVGEEELQKAKEHLSGRLILQLETSDEIAGFYGGEEVMAGRVRMPEEILEKYRQVTAGDILAVARDIMRDDRLNFSAIGPFEDKTESDIADILKF